MDVIPRLAAFLIAILLAIDAFSGERTETLRVDRHTQISRWHQGDDYRLHFAGGRVGACDVGWTTFHALADGDVVTVDGSRVFKSCHGIRRGAEVLASPRASRWLTLVPIAMLLAVAFGWIQFERRVEGERGWWYS